MKRVFILFLSLVLSITSLNVVSLAANSTSKDLVKQFEFVVKNNELVKKYLTEDEIQFYRNIVNIKVSNPKITVEDFQSDINSLITYSTTATISIESPGFWPFTNAETALIFLYPTQALIVNACKNSTDNWASTFYPGWQDGDIGNGYRHAFWNALMSKEIGLYLAGQFATAHEDHGLTDAEYAATSWNGFNGLQHKNMDLSNNAAGRTWGYPNNGEWDIHQKITSLISLGLVQHLF